jgi:hypothetical protein
MWELASIMRLARFLLMTFMSAVLVSPVMAAEAPSGSGNSGEKKPFISFVELQTAKISTRYNFVANDRGVTMRNHQQHKETFNIRFLFDGEGKYSLNTMAGSGASFTSSWDNLGIGSDASSHLNFRELFLSLKPWSGLDLQYGGISPLRGAATEITTYDNDAFILGSRISLKKPKELFFDEITGTLAYLGDLNEPDVFHRFDRFDQANYHQILVSKKIGKRATISGDYTSQWGIATLRQAVQVTIPELRLVDFIRFENYQRIEGDKAFGFAIEGDRKISRRVTLGGGFADIDEFYGGLNADRFGRGKRLFAHAKFNLIHSLSAEAFIQQAVGNDFWISNDVRLDLVLTYDLLPAFRQLGLFRIPK